jgi:integrase-like protein
LIHVRKQLERKTRQRVAPKTRQAVRGTVLMPALGRLLKAHKEASFAVGRAKPSDYVFTTEAGTPFSWRNVSRRGLGKAIERAGLDVEGKPTLKFHGLRDTFASILIAQGHDVVFVSRQLGHANPAITLNTYAHLFDGASHAERARESLEAQFGGILGSWAAFPRGASVANFESRVGDLMKKAFKYADKAPHERNDADVDAIREAGQQDSEIYTEAFGRIRAQGQLFANRDYYFDALDALVSAAQGEGLEFKFGPGTGFKLADRK